MILELPETTTSTINKRLVQLRASAGAVALGRVLTLVVVTSDAGAEAAIAAATSASREHPSRVLVVVRGDAGGPSRLDAQIRVGGDAGAGEIVVLRLRGELTGEGASAVVPLLLPDAPVVTWWAEESPAVPSADPLGRLAQRRITDSAACSDPHAALRQRAASYVAGDTDLAWTRLTRWRGLLAAALDLPPHEPVVRASVSGAAESPSVSLLAAWLLEAFACPVSREVDDVVGVGSVSVVRSSGAITISRPDGHNARISQHGEPEHTIALPKRELAECLAEELRRLDPDVVFGKVVTNVVPVMQLFGSRGGGT